MSRLIALLLLAAAAVAALPAVASADDAVAETSRPTPLASYGGWSAWSNAGAGGRYVLRLRSPGGTVADAPLPSSASPWDVSLGPDASGRVVAVYRRCRASGCDVDRLDVVSGRVGTIRAVSSPSYDEATPAIWRSTVVFTRRIGGCDVPYSKDLRSRAPSRRLLRTKCLQTAAGQASIRGTRILVSSVDLSGADRFGAGIKVSEIRRYSARGGASSVLIRQTFGEESNVFGQVSQDDRFAWTVRTGIHQANTFVRIPLGHGDTQEVRAFRTLGSGFAYTPDHGSLYVELQDEAGCSTFDSVPCRIVAAPADPFGSTVHALTPELTVAYAGTPHQGQPLAFSGALTRRIVAGGEQLRIDPVPGVSVDLRARVGQQPERFVGTGLTATTGVDGGWAITLPSLPGSPWYTAVAATPGVVTWAGRGTVG
jgi:hypothetical protein